MPPRGGLAGGFRGGFAGGVGGPRPATCYKCGGPNHYARDCQAQAMKCYACGKLVSGCSEESLCSQGTDCVRGTSRATALRQTEVLSIPRARSATNVAKPGTSRANAPQRKPMVRSSPTLLLSQCSRQRPQRPSLRHLICFDGRRLFSYLVI